MLSLGNFQDGRMSRVFLKAFGIMQHSPHAESCSPPVLRRA
jgi:hypothetical protein